MSMRAVMVVSGVAIGSFFAGRWSMRAAEVAPAGVTVNVVSPGLIEHAESHRDSQLRLLPRVPVGRLGTTADVVGFVQWLLGPESGYVTGENFTIDGGLQL